MSARRAAAVVLAVVASVSASARAAVPGRPSPDDAPRLVHMLLHIGSDYGRAVEAGRVRSADEYDEQLEQAEEADELAARLDLSAAELDGAPDVTGPVGRLRALVRDRAPEADVARVAAEAAARVASAFPIEEAPPETPRRERGAALFLELCAPCHGADGRADTPVAASLHPPPPSFHDPRTAAALTPFRVAGAVRFGLGDSAMPAFPSLSDADRWDLAFHVPALRHGATPPERALELPLAELSTRSDAEIEASLAREGVAPSRRAGALAHLRVEAPYDAEPAAPPSPSSDVAVRGALAFALLAAAAYLLAGRRGRGADGASSKGALTGRALALGAACALALGVAFGGGAALRAARSPSSSPFAWTVHLVAPEPVRRGTAHLVFEGDERMARFDARNDARFEDLPASYRARTPRLVVQTAPEMEPSWSPQRRFSLRRSTLEVHARPERARFGVVALYRSERSPEPQIARAERFNLGDDDLPAGVLVDRATLGLRVLASDLPASSRFVATPGASPRWLRPSVPFDHVDERETLIVLVDRALWDELGDAPEPYVVRARAAIAAP